MNKKNFFCLAAALMLAFSLCAGAAADGARRTVTWRVTEAKIDTDALVSLTFTMADGKAAPHKERKDTDGGRMPICSASSVPPPIS